MSERYRAVCFRCGKAGTSISVANGKRPSIAPPKMNGKCPSSSDGEHKPRWEKE